MSRAEKAIEHVELAAGKAVDLRRLAEAPNRLVALAIRGRDHHARNREGDYTHVGVATAAGALFLGLGRYPDGLDAECVSFAAIERAAREATSPPDREHVTPYIWRHEDLFRCGRVTSPIDYSQLRWTVDNDADFDLIARVFDALERPGRVFGMDDVLRYLAAHPELAATNEAFIGKEGYLQVWQGVRNRAKG